MTKSIAALPQVLNGVHREKLTDTITAVTAQPSLGRFQFRLSNQWVGGGENRSRIDDFFGAGEVMRHKQPFFLVNDEPEVLLSDDRAPNPVEYVLHALAGCLTTAMVYHAAARGIAIKGVTTRFEGDLDLRGMLGIADVRRGFQTIRAVFDIDADCTESEKKDLIALGQTFSPVFDIVTNGVPVQCELGKAAVQAAA